MKKRTVPEHFCTIVRKVEPVGGDCIRIYHCIERSGVWEDVFTVLIPIASVLTAARFVTNAATEIFNESHSQAEDLREMIH